MTARKPLVMVGGRPTQLPDGDTLLAALAEGGGVDMIEAIPLSLTSVGQTSIEVPGGYEENVVLVSRNGALLDVGKDYEATDGINIVLAYPITSLQEAVTVYRVTASTVANTYSQTQINALLANKQAQINAMQAAVNAMPVEVSSRLGAAVSNNTVTPQVLLALEIPKAGLYEISAVVRYRAVVATTGLGLGINAATGELNAQVQLPIAAPGSASFFEASLTASGVVALSTAVQASNTDFCATVSGSYVAVGPETLNLMYRSEVANRAVTVQINSYFRAREIK